MSAAESNSAKLIALRDELNRALPYADEPWFFGSRSYAHFCVALFNLTGEDADYDRAVEVCCEAHVDFDEALDRLRVAGLPMGRAAA